MKKGIKIVTIGKTSEYTLKLIESFIHRSDELPIQELWLVDAKSNEDQLESMMKSVKSMFEKENLLINVFSSWNQKEALVDADYVITHLDNNSFSNSDLHENSNASQQVFSALSTIPVMFDIINDIKVSCENAWLINITNPAGIISETVFRYADFDHYIGVCNVPSQLTNHFANELNVKSKDLIPYFAGLNHLSYAMNVYHKNKDKLPQIISMTKDSMHNPYQWNYEFIKELGVYPSPYHQYYYHHDEIDKFTGVNIDEAILYCCDVACSIISSIHNDKRDYQVVNTVNNGHITDLPDGCAIEITSRITKYGPVPVHIGRLPIQIRGLIQSVKAFEELLVDAIYEKDLKKVLLALQIHPSTQSITNAKRSFDAFIDGNQQNLFRYEEGK
ncbi:MAG: 6-phospho-beta-glucosidase [Tenericutes bacterium]|nr:6-phospho-beta-glucosidase [Mycoplasmatota bacterium]